MPLHLSHKLGSGLPTLITCLPTSVVRPPTRIIIPPVVFIPVMELGESIIDPKLAILQPIHPLTKVVVPSGWDVGELG